MSGTRAVTVQDCVIGGPELVVMAGPCAVESREQLVALPAVLERYQQTLDDLNSSLAQFERIKRFALLPTEFTMERGELTPTMKVRRQVVEERWRAVIEELYAYRG